MPAPQELLEMSNEIGWTQEEFALVGIAEVIIGGMGGIFGILRYRAFTPTPHGRTSRV